MRRFALPLILAGLVVAGCSKKDPVGPPPAGPVPIEEEEFAPELKIDLTEMTRTESGLYLQDLVVGTGKVAEEGMWIEAHYVGWLADGTQFDSSLGGQPIAFNLAHGNVIRGWVEGVSGMRVGGTRKLVIPSNLAYGARGNSMGKVKIPPHANLVFQVALVGVVGGEEN